MTENTENFILGYLKTTRSQLDRMEHDLRDVKFRMGQVEETLMHHTHRFDRMDDRLTRIEKRLDLTDA